PEPAAAPWPAPPEGRAGPPTEAGARGPSHVRLGLEVFAEYMYRRTQAPVEGASWFHSFELPRAHGAIEGEWERARGRVLLEAVRSASEGSLVGVSGDSLVLRVREAYGAYRPLDILEISGGVVPTLTIPELDGTWMMRAVAPSALEANALASPADLGVKVRSDLPGQYGWLALAAYNGEGYTSRELNRGKTVEGAFELHPLPRGPLLPLGIFASYTNGSTSTVTARADRVTTGLVWQGVRIRGGAFFTYAWGLAQAGTQHAAVGSAFVRVEPLPRLLAGAKVDVAVRDVRTAPADAISTVWLTLGYRVAEPLEVFLAGSRAIPTARADAEVPGSDAWALRVIGRVVF
ncbi:MAG TPA: hypothetical protein VLT33_30445, partial [Labilithrix sp.]|nr:hypothetical protein [Labilithrix sp.]